MCIRDRYIAAYPLRERVLETVPYRQGEGYRTEGWVISNEPFFKNMTRTVDLLKLRASYGIVGNDNIGGTGDRFAYFTHESLLLPYIG